jgi:regulator of sigma E protease
MAASRDVPVRGRTRPAARLEGAGVGLKIGFALVIGMALVATFNDIKLIVRQFAL